MDAAVSGVWVVEMLASQFAGFLALLLGASAAHKFIAWGRATRAARELTGLGRMSSEIAVAAAAALEIGAAVLLCLPQGRVAGAVLAALVWSAYLYVLLGALTAGVADCGCSFGAAGRSPGRFEAARAFALLVSSAAVGLIGYASPPLAPVGPTSAATASQWLAAAALFALYVALENAVSLRAHGQGRTV